MTDPKAHGDRGQEDIPYVKMEPGWVPLEWVVLAKCIAPNGEVRYREMMSKGLQPVEALGMLCTMEDTIRMRIMRSARAIGED